MSLKYSCEQGGALQEFGELMPSLKMLKMNESVIHSLRDMGTSLRNLKILYISKCQLSDISGINAFPLLQELYASYNFISDLR